MKIILLASLAFVSAPTVQERNREGRTSALMCAEAWTIHADETRPQGGLRNRLNLQRTIDSAASVSNNTGQARREG